MVLLIAGGLDQMVIKGPFQPECFFNSMNIAWHQQCDMGIVSCRISWRILFSLQSFYDSQFFLGIVMSSEGLNLILVLKPTVCPRQIFLLLPVDKRENFVLERMVINSLFLYCLQEKWQSLQKTQAWMRGVDRNERLKKL